MIIAEIDSDNYFTGRYADVADWADNPFTSNYAITDLPPELGIKNTCYKLITAEGGEHTWELDEDKYNSLIADTPDGKIESLNEAVMDLIGEIIGLI